MIGISLELKDCFWNLKSYPRYGSGLSTYWLLKKQQTISLDLYIQCPWILQNIACGLFNLFQYPWLSSMSRSRSTIAFFPAFRNWWYKDSFVFLILTGYNSGSRGMTDFKLTVLPSIISKPHAYRRFLSRYMNQQSYKSQYKPVPESSCW